MRPGILALTSTSFASTVPMSIRSLGARAVSRYQVREPSVSSPRMRNTLFRAFIVPPKYQRIAFQFGHGRIGKNASRQFSAALPIDKNRLPEKFNQSFSARCQRIRRERLEGHQLTPYRRAEEIENIGAHRCERNLKPIHIDELAGRDALTDHCLQHGLDGAEDTLDQHVDRV